MTDGVAYRYPGNNKEGVSRIIFTAVSAPVPYSATLDIDLQGTSA